MSTDEQAVDQLLGREPDNIAALVRKGDFRTAAGDERAGTAFYKAALQAAAAARTLPMSLKPAIERAQAGMARAAGVFARYLEQGLVGAGLPPAKRPPRFQQSIDLMLGRRQASLQLQRPTSYYMPGLPQRPYYERSEFPWAAEVEAAAGAIREEMLAFSAARGDRFSPYLVNDSSRPRGDFHGLLDNPDWSTLYIWEKGAPVAEFAPAFPRTLRTMEQVDLPHIGVRAPSVLFSRLSAGARIPAHNGMLNARLICHLPLIVPPGCGFRVGGETRQWQEGELLIFDDSVEHEAWNDGPSDRVVLIFDIWRPELSAEERHAVTTMFEVIDSYGQ
jgi:aspartyl/asparaginyl beta-hydroxylase (cupin superfamily)